MFSLAKTIFIFSALASAKEVTVVQAGQMFLPAESEAKAAQICENPAAGKGEQLKTIKLKVGDTIEFKNLDKIAHNVYGEDFDLQSQKPGETRAQTFKKDGHFTVHCAIHPKMKLDVEVEK